MKKNLVLIMATLSLLLSCNSDETPQSNVIASVSLDTTFGYNGLAINGFYRRQAYVNDACFQSDGKIIVVGVDSNTDNNTTVKKFAIARYNTDGSLDNSFSNDGMITMGIPTYRAATDSRAMAVAALPSGKILVAGTMYVDGKGIAIFRFNSDGSQDTSFGSNGTVFEPLLSNQTYPGFYSAPGKIYLQNDGKFILCGARYYYINTVNRYAYYSCKAFLQRFNENGTVDASFGNNGISFIENQGTVAALFGEFEASKSQHLFLTHDDINNKLIVNITDTRQVFRFSNDGILDAGFTTDGSLQNGNYFGATSTNYSNPFGISHQGNYLFVSVNLGQSQQSYFLKTSRYTPEGSIDPTYGTSGTTSSLVVDYIPHSSTTLAEQSDGKILIYINESVVDGIVPLTQTHNKITLTRMNANGTIDNTFGVNGVLKNEIEYDLFNISRILIDSNNKIYLVGTLANRGGDSYFGIFKYVN